MSMTTTIFTGCRRRRRSQSCSANSATGKTALVVAVLVLATLTFCAASASSSSSMSRSQDSLADLAKYIIRSRSKSVSTEKTNLNAEKANLQTYLVHVPAVNKPAWFPSIKDWHLSLLSMAATIAETAQNYHHDSAVTDISKRLLYSYAAAFQGFAARLTKEEAAALESMVEVSILSEGKPYQPHTTRSPTFLGLFAGTTGASVVSPGRLFRAAKGGRDIIIGMIDSGIWPERRSFANDSGFSPIPARWNGRCENVPTFVGPRVCNRKLIGARAFYMGLEARLGHPLDANKEYSRSPRDRSGHGTHTTSTTGGNIVPGANLFGYANGTAVGVAPNARLAVYKVCWSDAGCYGTDIIAAFDAAIADGVDVISISVGGKDESYAKSPIAIGAFAAAMRGIVTVASAGNSGPDYLTVSNAAPWILTIAASTVDRDFPATLMLGNGNIFRGASRYSGGRPDIAQKVWPLVYGETCVALDASVARGAVLLCEEGGGIPGEQKGLIVQQAGGVGVVYVKDGEDLTASPGAGAYLIPTVVVGWEAGWAIYQYVSNEDKPTIKLDLKHGNTRVGVPASPAAPAMARFSSRGPNALTPELLKPDITAPGVGILAAWSDAMSPTTLDADKRRVDFNIIQGTSMSCPHVSGIVALIKAAHPTWSPAMIRSALITTAYTRNNRGQPILDLSNDADASLFAMGAGHVNPNAALDPGLVYNTTAQDYVDFMCSIGYNASTVRTFTKTLTCNRRSSIRRPGDLNYPSFSVIYLKSQADAGSPTSFTYYRTLTNVSPVKSNYTVTIIPPPNVRVTVKPAVLSFLTLYQKLSYSVTFTPDPAAFRDIPTASIEEGSLTWADGRAGHRVRSPVAFTWVVDVL